jgi:hypothetical protein
VVFIDYPNGFNQRYFKKIKLQDFMSKNDITGDAIVSKFSNTYADKYDAIFRNKDLAKCAGQAPDGSMVCAYREQCKRYVMPASNHQAWSEFWRGGDNCPNYIVIG